MKMKHKTKHQTAHFWLPAKFRAQIFSPDRAWLFIKIWLFSLCWSGDHSYIWWIENRRVITMTTSFYFYSTPRIFRIFRFFQKLSNDWYIVSRYKRSMILIQWKIIFSTSAKDRLSCDIKSLRWKVFTSIFHPVLFHVFDFLYNNLIPLSNIL